MYFVYTLFSSNHYTCYNIVYLKYFIDQRLVRYIIKC